jgi:hypothetical protein
MRVCSRRVALAGALAVALALPGQGLAADCFGDGCQGPPPAPEEVIPATSVVTGPQNPPVRFPKPHQAKKHHHKRGKR